MPMLWDHWYLLRPTATLLAQADVDRVHAGSAHTTAVAGALEGSVPQWGRPIDAQSSGAWFAAPHLWMLSRAGNHDYEGQETLVVGFMKLRVLATLHAEMQAKYSTPELRELARRIVDAAPLTVERFDELWTVEDLGPFRHDGNWHDDLPVDSLRAVRAPEGLTPDNWRPQPVREIWSAIIQERENLEPAFVSTVRLVLRVLQSEFAVAADERRCDLAIRLPTFDALGPRAFEGQPWSLERNAPLRLTFEHARDGFHFTFDWRPSDGRRRRGRLVVQDAYPSGQRVEMEFDERKVLEPGDVALLPL